MVVRREGLTRRTLAMILLTLLVAGSDEALRVHNEGGLYDKHLPRSLMDSLLLKLTLHQLSVPW